MLRRYCSAENSTLNIPMHIKSTLGSISALYIVTGKRCHMIQVLCCNFTGHALKRVLGTHIENAVYLISLASCTKSKQWNCKHGNTGANQTTIDCSVHSPYILNNFDLNIWIGEHLAVPQPLYQSPDSQKHHRNSCKPGILCHSPFRQQSLLHQKA